MSGFLAPEKILEIFKSLFERGELSHGYILFGENPSLQENFVLRFAKILEKKEGASLPLNDFLFFDSDNDSIGIDEVRRLKYFLSEKPVASEKRTVAVKFAGRLTKEAENALLKISEDPFSSSLIFLLVSNRHLLLPTLNSRFQSVFFSAPFSPPAPSLKGKEVLSFINSSSSAKTSFIKKILDEDKKNENTEASSAFLESLILELSRDVKKNSALLKKILELNSSLSEFNLNRRLAFLSLSEELS